ncbi:tRNA pseudouridine(13) synthase TruD [Lysobacter sp. TY2-98]|uniref:tRNA pseudouridine(13) synthase TruD n=1 Tax=Lysobacter sp. TY2-98 TaxID=2290922 RepID=UPI000E20C72E|nr:tRNA pseudouridine(13) synthase TruD [Lysobacter sp. TY2-98]AXK72421.1 tRNA pseudouridine(13) synthase TruD [Lysobacter sp. TY2-98]
MSTALPQAHGAPVLTATFRTQQDDFIVEEIPGFEPTGSGEHLLLEIEKRGQNTAFVARRIAEWAGVKEVAIGYAGLKDRHAVTRQRFTVHLPGRESPDVSALEDASLRVLSSTRHARKLPRGALAGNRFTITLRDVDGDRTAIEARLSRISKRGVPNYFGEQRFGRAGDNVAQALAMFAGRRVRREERSLLLSAARSELFNRVLAERVRTGSWDGALDGEVWMLDGRRSVFGPESFDDALAARLAAFDIHPTGPLWGRGELRTTGACRELERACVDADNGPALQQGLERAGLEQERRALRLRPDAMGWRWPAEYTLELRFSLPPGAYATCVLDALGDVTSAAGRSV